MKFLARLAGVAAIAGLTGCAHAGDHWRDFTECFRADAEVGLGVYAGFRVGDLLHVGQGFHGGGTACWMYGAAGVLPKQEAHLLVLHGEGRTVRTWREGSPNPQVPDCGGCLLIPILLNTSSDRRRWSRGALHHADLELVLFGGVAGLTLGFSPGEFVDFVFGFFGIEMDPPDARRTPTEEKIFDCDR